MESIEYPCFFESFSDSGSWINTFVLNGICLVDDPSLVFDERKEQNGSHHFFQQLFAVPVHCVVCKKTVFMGKTSYKCKFCGLSAHKVCLSETQNNCISEVSQKKQSNVPSKVKKTKDIEFKSKRIKKFTSFERFT